MTDTIIFDDTKTWQDIVTKEGKNYRERERIKRKIQRWIDNVQKMSDLERRTFIAAMQEEGISKPPADLPKKNIIAPISRISDPEQDSKPDPEPGHPQMKEWFIKSLIKKYGGSVGIAPIWKIRQEYPYKDFDLMLKFLAGLHRIKFLHGDSAATPETERRKNPKDRAGIEYTDCQWIGEPDLDPEPIQDNNPISTSAEGRMKLKQAGFRIFRAEKGRNIIKEFSHEGSWRKHSEYKSNAAMQRAFKDLLAEEKHIEA